jgi:hypothetical protein
MRQLQVEEPSLWRRSELVLTTKVSDSVRA